MRVRQYLYLLCAVVAAFGLTACHETDDEVDEFPDWKDKNEAFFAAKYNAAKQAIGRGDNSWKVFKSYAKNTETTGQAADYIVVKVLQEGSGSGCPLFTDSVRVHYRGQLIASTSYKDSEDSELGLVFDKSWRTDVYEPNTFVPAKFAVSRVVDGFSTALQHMHIGDRWKVYIPYQLGYSDSGSGSVPGYSTLVFDITLVAYYRAGTVVPAWNTNQSFLCEENL
ncbi:MAG: FKBP-type peptidyl-prolyl cis-trans isomerase [Prevotella sp.]|nr:FKBP-type peptidyl-prolyl cis-trans isomerase [Prevotella sp.]